MFRSFHTVLVLATLLLTGLPFWIRPVGADDTRPVTLVIFNHTDASLLIRGFPIEPSEGRVFVPRSMVRFSSMPGAMDYNAVALCVDGEPKARQAFVAFAGRHYEVVFGAAHFGKTFMADSPGCNASAVKDHQPFCSFAGTWKTSWQNGEGSTATLTIRDEDGVFRGTYDWMGGTLTGKLDDKGRLVGDWSQTNDASGDFRFEMDGCDHFEGFWNDPHKKLKGDWFGDRRY